MIELPRVPAPNNVRLTMLDFGMQLQPSSGAPAVRVDRPGNRYRATFSFPPMEPEVAGVFVSRLLRAKSEGVRLPIVLLQEQGAPGAPVVDGAGQAGTSLAVRGLTPHYTFRETSWLSIVAADGTRYLHASAATVRADEAGEATFQITPMLWADFPDGAELLIARPEIEGFVLGDAFDWEIPIGKRIALEFTVEEAG